MGYRSDVAILMYGEPQDCDVVCNLFAASDVEQGLKEYLDREKKEAVYDGVKYVLWELSNIKWYSDCEHAQAKLFEFVDALEDNREETTPPNPYLAIEFVRIGEEDSDTECDRSSRHEFLLTVQRSFDYPNVFNSKGE